VDLVPDVGMALAIWRARVTTTSEAPTAQSASAEKPCGKDGAADGGTDGLAASTMVAISSADC
jgi:hypothetical protein